MTVAVLLGGLDHQVMTVNQAVVHWHACGHWLFVPCSASCCGVMNSSRHCPIVSTGLLTVCPMVFGLEKIS